MSYKALYRKYRPQTFEDVIGQDHIIHTSKIKLTIIICSYLFVVPEEQENINSKGAKTVNCLQPRNPVINVTLFRFSKVSMNVIEIDAASNKANNIQKLEGQIFSCKMVIKSILLDEVHMLSTGAFNALLKL